jgi:ABC-2 type transport system permease protein
MRWRRILHLVKKEIAQIRRDRRMLVIVLGAPVFQLFLFGYAVTTDVKHVSMAVYDADRSQQSRDFVEGFVRSGYFDLDHQVDRPSEITRLLDSGGARVGVSIPPGFAADLARWRPAQVQLLLDGSDSMSAGMVSGYIVDIVRDFSENVSRRRLDQMRFLLPAVPSIENRLRVWYNPDLKSVNFMVPGVVAMILMVITMILTSLAIVREREVGTLEQLIVTPIRPIELMLGKMIPFVAIGLFDVILIVVVARFWFGVPLRGSALLLFSLAGLFVMTSLGLGLFISTVSRTQQQAMMMSFFLMMPSVLLSGFLFPIANMPRVIQWMTYAIPLRYFVAIVRGIFLKGSGLGILWPNVLALFALGLVILTISARRFTKRLE